MSARRTSVLVLVLLSMVAGAVAPSAEELDAKAKRSKVGRWTPPFAEDPLFARRPPQNPRESKRIPPAVSIAVLPDGRVVYWGGLESIEDSEAPLAADAARTATESRVRVMDLRGRKPRWTVPRPETGGKHDLFCADQRLLYNGKLLAVGGTIWRDDPVDVPGDEPPGGTTELFGSNAVRWFDPKDNRWTLNRDFMKYSRWYPTLITLPRGNLFVASGIERLIYNDSGTTVHQTEIFKPRTNKWKQTGASGEASLPLFARMHLLPDGTVFYSGVGQMWSPAGAAADEALWNIHKAYNPRKKSWVETGIGAYGARSGAFSVLMPLRPPYKRAQILVGGGTLGTPPGSYQANNLTEIITVKDGQSTSIEGPPLNNMRWYTSAVPLPDGTVVAVSGGTRDEVLDPGTEAPVRQAELFDGEKWVPLSLAGRDRTYHNSAILLADGSILVGGHSPINAAYGPKGDPANDDSGQFANNLKDPSFEIFKPPYLFRGARPSIDRVQRGIKWRRPFRIDTSDARDVEQVVLVRLPSTTHITDPDMRVVELKIKKAGRESLTVTAPPSGKVAPPGYYYLFALAENGKGLTPSKAHVVRVGREVDNRPARAPMGK